MNDAQFKLIDIVNRHELHAESVSQEGLSAEGYLSFLRDAQGRKIPELRVRRSWPGSLLSDQEFEPALAAFQAHLHRLDEAITHHERTQDRA